MDLRVGSMPSIGRIFLSAPQALLGGKEYAGATIMNAQERRSRQGERKMGRREEEEKSRKEKEGERGGEKRREVGSEKRECGQRLNKRKVSRVFYLLIFLVDVR